MNRLKTISKYVLGSLIVAAGSMHFINPQFFLKIMPRYLPFHMELVYLSGVCEIALGALLLIPGYSQMAAWGLIALLFAVFPANIYLYQNQHLMPASPATHLIRLPFQGLLVLWAYWHTRRP